MADSSALVRPKPQRENGKLIAWVMPWPEVEGAEQFFARREDAVLWWELNMEPAEGDVVPLPERRLVSAQDWADLEWSDA